MDPSEKRFVHLDESQNDLSAFFILTLLLRLRQEICSLQTYLITITLKSHASSTTFVFTRERWVPVGLVVGQWPRKNISILICYQRWKILLHSGESSTSCCLKQRYSPLSGAILWPHQGGSLLYVCLMNIYAWQQSHRENCCGLCHCQAWLIT